MKVLDENFKNIQHDVSNLRIAIIQLLCLEKLYKEEKYNLKIGLIL